MKLYKSIFNESLNDLVNFRQEAKQIVDISNLRWSKSFKFDWYLAKSKCPKLWRLPTVQELYSAFESGVDGFDKSGYYWSSSTSAQHDNRAWNVDFNLGLLFISDITSVNHVRYVRDI
jgi:hypothetical protein